jgi:hypothetical protein
MPLTDSSQFYILASDCGTECSSMNWGLKMKVKFFAALLGASVLMVAPVQAKITGLMISDPKVMLPICKEEIAQGHAGVCTGYVIGVAQGMQSRNEICIPLTAGYEDMVQVVLSWIEPALERATEVQRYMLVDTQTALRNVWSCKK